MSKRGNGEGGITRHKKSGLYMARYTVHTAARPKRKTLYGKTRSEVAAKLSKALADREGGFTYDAGKQTVEEYLARWLLNSVRDRVRQRTYERYESIAGCIWRRPSGKLSSRLSRRTTCAVSTARSWMTTWPRAPYYTSTGLLARRSSRPQTTV